MLVGCFVYGWLVPSTAHPTGWEHVVARSVHVGAGSRLWALTNLLIRVGSPVAVAAIAIGLAAGLVASGRTRTAAGAFVSVAFGSVGAELAKHVVDRRIGVHGALAYPSGHTAGATAAVMTMVLVVAPSAAPSAVRRLASVGPLLVGGAVGLAMVSHGSHYAADVVGGVAFGTCVPLALLGWPVAVASSALDAPAVHDAELPVLPVRQPVSAEQRFGVREQEPTTEAASGSNVGVT